MRPSTLALALCLSSAACRSSDEQAARAEAASIHHAIDVVRSAPEKAKHASLEKLERTPCSAEDRCQLRKLCVEAYRLHTRAMDMLAAAKDDVASNDAVAAGDLSAVLLGAEKDLKRSIALTKECADAQGTLVRRYSL